MSENFEEQKDLHELLNSDKVNAKPDKWLKASNIKNVHKRMQAYAKLIEEERNEEPYPRKLVQYSYDNSQYYVMHGYDFCSHAVAVTEENKGLLANYISKTKVETQTTLLYCILDDCEDMLFLPDDLRTKALTIIKENHLESFQSELNHYCFASSDKKPKKHPLENTSSETKKLVNMMLENFSLVTIEKDFPAPSGIIAVEKLGLE